MTRSTATLAAGALLVALGLLLLAWNLLDIRLPAELAAATWPLGVVAVGVVLLAAALGAGEAGEPLAIIGGIVTATGAVLTFQAATGLWATWAYLWGVAVVVGAGVGLGVYGLLTGRPGPRSSGRRLATVGLVLTAAFGAFFELIVDLNGLRDELLGSTALAAAVLVVGVVLVLSGLFGRRARPVPVLAEEEETGQA